METLKYKDLLQRYVQKQLQTKNELSFLEEQDLLEMGFSRFLINRWKQQYHKVGIEILPCPKDELRRRNQKESEANQKFKEYYDYPTKELRDNLIVDLLWLADEMTQKFAKLSGLETSDLVSYAYEGLLKAMKTSQKYGFCAIAREEIQKLLLEGIAIEKGIPIEWEVNMEDAKFYLHDELENLSEEEVTEACIAFLERQGRVDAKEKGKYRSAFLHHHSLQSHKEDLPSHQSVEEEVIGHTVNENLKKTISELPKNYQKVMEGLYEREDSASQIARDLNWSKWKVRDVNLLCLRKLRRAVITQPLSYEMTKGYLQYRDSQDDIYMTTKAK